VEKRNRESETTHKEVKKALIYCFEGTALDCFDENYNPIPRNPTNIVNPL
jgi:hypothetical protein